MRYIVENYMLNNNRDHIEYLHMTCNIRIVIIEELQSFGIHIYTDNQSNKDTTTLLLDFVRKVVTSLILHKTFVNLVSSSPPYLRNAHSKQKNSGTIVTANVVLIGYVLWMTNAGILLGIIFNTSLVSVLVLL